MKSPPSAPSWPPRSSPRLAWTWPASPAPATWHPGPGYAARPSNPAPAPAPAKARATPGCGATWARAAIAAARTSTFPGERYRRLARRRGAARAQVAVARSILIIIWHLLNDPTARYHDLGPGHYQARTDKSRKARNHIRQLQALGYTVTITQAA
jgi:hypothetical protein